MLHDEACLARLLSILTVRRMSQFGDAALYRAIRTFVVPLLRTYPFVRIWNTGCATGEEAVSLAILLQEEGIAAKCRIYATDAVASVVDSTRQGIYSASSMAEWSDNYAAAGGSRSLTVYFSIKHGRTIVDPALRKLLVFAQHNLVSDGSFNQFQLIFCPGLLSQFNLALQSRAHGVLLDSLGRLGFMTLGQGESMNHVPAGRSYRAVEAHARMYRRID